MEKISSVENNTVKVKNEKPSKFGGFMEIVESFVFAVVFIAILFTFFVRVSIVDGTSMENTLVDGDYLVVANPMFAYTPKNGDIVVVHGHFEDKEVHVKYHDPIVKRVIALAGQEIKIDCKNLKVYVDGVLLTEDYAKYIYRTIPSPTNTGGNYDANTGIYTATVPEGYVFVMGDNRGVSLDSRYEAIGFVDEDLIVGKVIFRVLPFEKFGSLD